MELWQILLVCAAILVVLAAVVRPLRRHPLAQMLTIGLVASLGGVALSLGIDWFPPVGSTAAEKIDTLWDVLLVFSVPIFVLVMTIAIYSVARFRARPGDEGDGPPIHGHTGLEVLWVTVPFLIVAVLAVYGYVVLREIEEPLPDTMEVEVTGQQFAWSFAYPDAPGDEAVKSNELVLPVGRPVNFKIEALDVIHSFWVPAFRLKEDAVPGITTGYRVTPQEVGRFDIVCAELCGIGHATMRQTARVVPEEEFDAWLEERAGGGAAGQADSPAEEARAAQEIYASVGCDGCHRFEPVGGTATTGPDLTELSEVAGERTDQSPEDYVRESIIDPDAHVVEDFSAGTMPGNYEDQLQPEEVDALVEFLLEPQGGGK